MQTPAFIKESLVYKIPAKIFCFLAKYLPYSLINKFFTNTPIYTQKTIVSQSTILNLWGKFLSFILSPLVFIGNIIKNALPYSFMNKPKAPFIQNSLSFNLIQKTKVEYALWLLVSYPLIDYILRNVPALESLSGGWDEILVFLIFIAWPTQMAIRGKIIWQKSFMDIPILIYAVIMVFLFLLRSLDISLAVEGIRVYLQYLICYFIATNLITTKNQWNSLLNGFIAVVTILSFIGIGQFVLGVEMPTHWVDQAEEGIRTRSFSLVTSPNVLGSLLVLFIPLTFSQVIKSKGNLKNISIYSLCLISMLLCIIFTYSRGAWLALAGAMLLYCFLYKPKTVLLLIVGGIALLKFIPGISSRMSYMFSSAYITSSLKAGRLSRWGTALEYLKENLWLGEGFGRFGGAVAARRIPGSFYVDNFYLKTGVECGLIGLLALFWMLLNIIRLAFWVLKSISEKSSKLLAVGLLSGLFGVMLHCGVENIFEVPLMCTYFWFITGMLAILPIILEKEEK